MNNNLFLIHQMPQLMPILCCFARHAVGAFVLVQRLLHMRLSGKFLLFVSHSRKIM